MCLTEKRVQGGSTTTKSHHFQQKINNLPPNPTLILMYVLQCTLTKPGIWYKAANRIYEGKSFQKVGSFFVFTCHVVVLLALSGFTLGSSHFM